MFEGLPVEFWYRKARISRPALRPQRRFSTRLEDRLRGLEKRVATGRLKDRAKIERILGRLQASYASVADLYEMAVRDEDGPLRLHWAHPEGGDAAPAGDVLRTLEMQSDVLQDGVLTVLATLVAGTHHRLLAISAVAVSKDGRVTERGSADSNSTPGARIDFVDEGAGEARTLYYFRSDLSNEGLARQGGLLAFVDTLPATVTFAKAAAYCMHGQTFSVIRDYVLTHSRAVLEDDSGVPLRYFDRASWDVRFFGRYAQPIPMFRSYRQPDLAEAFARAENVSPLPFHVGYGSKSASNMMLAVRRNAPSTARRTGDAQSQ